MQFKKVKEPSVTGTVFSMGGDRAARERLGDADTNCEGFESYVRADRGPSI